MMKLPTQRSKIVCTIGPASDAPKTNGWPVHDQLLRTEELGTGNEMRVLLAFTYGLAARVGPDDGQQSHGMGHPE